jgi:hypothetical protein
MLSVVANEKASEVWPEGNDRLEAGFSMVKLGSVSAGLGRFTIFFIA